MRTNRIRTTVLAATTAALALSLTACGGSGDSASRGGTGKSVVTADGTQSSERTTRTSDTVEQSGSGSGAGKAVPARAAKAKACTGDEISYAVLHRFPAEQGEHLLITATNTDAKSCWVTSFPSVMLGDSPDVLPHSSKDAPGGTGRITVKPGGKVYSAVALFADDGANHTSTELSVALRDQTGDTGPGAGTGAFDGAGVPSEFTWSDAEVTNWNTAKPYDF